MDKNERIKAYTERWGTLVIGEEPSTEQYFQYWQQIIDTGLWGELEGFYGRQAAHFIEEGYCVRPEMPLTDQVEYDREMSIQAALIEEEDERLSTQTFKTVVIDPPWNEQGGGKIKRGANRHYPLMKTPQIVSTILTIPQWGQIADNAHLYLWVTNNFLEQGLFVMKALGFTYKTNFVWVKNTIGLGQYFRGQHELCLFGTRGTKPTEPRTDNKSISSVLKADKTRHSSKPQSSYDLIEQRSKGGYMEIFARNHRPEWFCWGNEV